MHVAIIMDGNGRWAVQRGLPRPAGHRAGAETVRRIVEAAVASHVSVLTLYAFSADNWLRPRREVSALMKLMKRYLISERVRCLHQQRARAGERQRALAVDAAQHRRVAEVARGHQTRRPSVRVVIAAASRS